MLKLVLPKGSLEEATLNLFADADLAVGRSSAVNYRANIDDPRRTEMNESTIDHDDEDLIQKEDMVVTVSHRGYIKRVPLKTYRAQRRGGKGRKAMATREEEFVNQVFIANTKSYP